jgi:hypothetical protein
MIRIQKNEEKGRNEKMDKTQRRTYFSSSDLDGPLDIRRTRRVAPEPMNIPIISGAVLRDSREK